MRKTIFLAIILLVLLVTLFFSTQKTSSPVQSILGDSTQEVTNSPISTTIPQLPKTKTIEGGYQVFQSFNNCGPASLSMDLSYFGVQTTQEQLAEDLRPYQVANGDNDDKSVSLDELVTEAEKFNMLAYHRPNGNLDLLKKFIANDIPVITRTWLKPDEDIGHYRLVKGYDDNTQEIIQDDSFQGKNLHYSYEEFNQIWGKFDYEYVVVVPKDKQKQAEQIIGSDLNTKTAWQHAIDLSNSLLKKNPDDIYARFNLSVAKYNVGDYQGSVTEYEKVADKLPFRTLWYQLEPVEAYYQIGNYQKVFAITDDIFNHQNRAYSEAYIIRGKSYLAQKQFDQAYEEFQKAIYYNKNSKAAQDALADFKASI